MLKAVDVFRRIEALPFARESSELFDRPSINLGRIEGGDAFNKVPDQCTMDVDVRYLPGQDPGEILAQVRALPDVDGRQDVHRARRRSSRARTRTCARCARRSARTTDGEALSVGRDGASDAISFLEAGIPAVEFGPVGAGHHGPEEWVSISSLRALPRGARPTSCARCRSGSRASARRRERPDGDRRRAGVSA